MTAYSAIADSEIDPESPFTTTLATKYRDNSIAISEGSSGAPKIQNAAMDTASVDIDNFASDVGYREFIASGGAASSATVDLTNIGTTYRYYEIEYENTVPTTGGSLLYMRVQTGGSTWQTGSVYRVGASAQTQIQLSGLISQTVSEGGVNGIVRCFNPVKNVRNRQFDGRAIYSEHTTGDQLVRDVSYRYAGTEVLTGFRFFMSSGNINTAIFNLYGVF